MNTTEEAFPEGYQEIRDVLEKIARHYNRMEVEGLEHLPPPGQGGILCPSHENYSDPFYLGSAIPHRYLRFMGEMQAFEMPVVGKLAERMGVQGIKVESGRSSDSGDTRNTLDRMAEHVRAGHLCVVFPEGRIKYWIEGDNLRRFQTGAVRIAARSGGKLYPAGIYGTRWVVPNVANLKMKSGKEVRIWNPFPLPSKVMIAFGEGLSVNPRADGDKEIARAETERLRKAVFKLRQGLKKRYPGPLG